MFFFFSLEREFRFFVLDWKENGLLLLDFPNCYVIQIILDLTEFQ